MSEAVGEFPITIKLERFRNHCDISTHEGFLNPENPHRHPIGRQAGAFI